MEWYYIVLIVVVALILLYFAICTIYSYFMVNTLVNPYCLPYQEAVEKITKDRKLVNNYKQFYGLDEYFIDSIQGYKLKVAYIKSNQENTTKKAIVLVHGWTSNHIAMLPYANMYIKLGFHVFLYDHRNHMHSDKKVTTMGDKESIDLQCIVNHVKEKLGNDVIIGTHGESMGAFTVMMHAGRYHSVNFVCEDCGYNSLKELLTYQCKYLKKTPTFPTILIASILFKMKTKTSFKNLNVKNHLSTLDDIPMLFVHGDKDKFVPAYMVYKNYDSKNGYKEVKVYDCQRHAHCIVNHYETYLNDLTNFLKNINII